MNRAKQLVFPGGGAAAQEKEPSPAAAAAPPASFALDPVEWQALSSVHASAEGARRTLEELEGRVQQVTEEVIRRRGGGVGSRLVVDFKRRVARIEEAGGNGER